MPVEAVKLEAHSLLSSWWENVLALVPDIEDTALPAEPLPAGELERLGITEVIQLQAWAGTLKIPFRESLNDEQLLPQFVDAVPISYARRYRIAAISPIDPEATDIPVALGSLASWEALDALGRLLRRPLLPMFVPENRVLAALNSAYSEQADRSGASVNQLGERDEVGADGESNVDLLDSTDRSPVVKLVNSILYDAIRGRASDVHLQPEEDRAMIRQRIDGVLFDALTVPKEFQEEVTSRFKVMGKMDIAEKRLPQDGRASVQMGDRMIDLRIASLPTSFGERVVIRFLDKGARLYTLAELGMPAVTLEQFRRLIRLEHGLLLVTGPTGSGKSTTLYSAIQEINSKVRNVLTLEDPIEYRLEGVSQTQINAKKGLTFASGLRNVLRQDPDVIMVGEIRDRETAVMAIQSALTGHLVFSTLHTNDAASAITRLLDLGIEPFLVASSVVGVVAQRLVRKICTHCRSMRTEAEGLVKCDDLDEQWIGKGCQQCRQTGFQGRIGVFELLELSESIRPLIQERANAADIRRVAQAEGLTLLHEDAMQRVRDGQTTYEEAIRVTSRQ